MPAFKAQLEFAYGHCEKILRQLDPDRFFATLFVPAGKRLHLMALYAFSAEIAHIQEGIREPLTGEVGMQWWRDALGSTHEEVGRISAGHPVAAALNETIRVFNLPRQAFVNLIDARVFDLYQEPMPTLNELEGYCGETCSILFQLAASIMAGKPVAVSEAAGHGGVAYAMTGLIRAFPWHIRRNRIYLPVEILERYGADPGKVAEGGDGDAVLQAMRELRSIAASHLERALDSLGSVPEQARGAFLPLALVRPHLSLLDSKGYMPFETILDLPQWRKQWILWRAARTYR